MRHALEEPVPCNRHASTKLHVRIHHRTIAGTATRTPLVPAPAFAAIAGQPFLLKLETTQPTGAFKLRGALNALAHLPPDAKGVTCCSTGNHGRAVAYAARARGLKAVVCMSALVPQTLCF